MVGRRTGAQSITLGPNCTVGNAIHEIGHTVGLWHEQSREDRDLFVTINWQNIQAGMAAQFNQHITDGDDLGAYDYGSIMHYPRTAFSANGQDTITPTNPTAQIGQRNGLSAGDIAAVAAMYPGCTSIRPKKIIDEPVPIKKFRDDQRFKKFRDDEIVVKPLRDRVKPAGDIGPIKRDVPFQPPVVIQPGGLRPFAVATGHHAAFVVPGGGPADSMDDAAAAYIGGLQRQMLEVEAGIAQARATAAEANAEVARLSEAADALEQAYQRAVDEAGGA
jgi:hypothetical protein